ncbi:hypothetical protein WJX84_012178 [Apatococcus fuscideae]|uniref:Uncharacterized protein n=1 Tax=Apatococcus fuscideae TaxID=2026836 RepID=A0AAW1SCV3_9CHLO
MEMSSRGASAGPLHTILAPLAIQCGIQQGDLCWTPQQPLPGTSGHPACRLWSPRLAFSSLAPAGPLNTLPGTSGDSARRTAGWPQLELLYYFVFSGPLVTLLGASNHWAWGPAAWPLVGLKPTLQSAKPTHVGRVQQAIEAAMQQG